MSGIPLAVRQATVLRLLEAAPVTGLELRCIAETMCMSGSGLTRVIHQMRNAGVIERTSDGKGCHWILAGRRDAAIAALIAQYKEARGPREYRRLELERKRGTTKRERLRQGRYERVPDMPIIRVWTKAECAPRIPITAPISVFEWRP
jgi:DNA-binding MarR family transcriptional regulator